jgi:peptidoglycan/LPS O-acetylase OafA/YrhL
MLRRRRLGFSVDFAQLEHIAGAPLLFNLILWGEAGYFDQAAEFKPLLHLWSQIEEQFYLIGRS